MQISTLGIALNFSLGYDGPVVGEVLSTVSNEKIDEIAQGLEAQLAHAAQVYKEAAALDQAALALAWPQYLKQLLEYELVLIEAIRKKKKTEADLLENDLLRTSVAIRLASIQALQQEHSNLKPFENQRKKQLQYQHGGRAFSALFGMGQGAYCAGYALVLIGMEYFLHNIWMMPIGGPSFWMLLVLMPLAVTTVVCYWLMRKDMSIMAMKLYNQVNQRQKAGTQSKKTFKDWLAAARDTKNQRYLWAIFSAVVGGLLFGLMTAYGVYHLLPHASATAIAAFFFVTTAIPVAVLNINHNIDFWAAPLKKFKDAYRELNSQKGNHYFARFAFWFCSATVSMLFSVWALIPFTAMAGIPIFVAVPLLSGLILSNLSFYFNLAYAHVSMQRNIEEGLQTATLIKPEQITPRFKVMRLCHAFSSALISVVGFMSMANTMGWIKVYGDVQLALTNMSFALDFTSPSTAIFLCLSLCVGVIAFATFYIANAAGEQQGYEAALKDDIRFLKTPKDDLVQAFSPVVQTAMPLKFWYGKDQASHQRYVRDLQVIAGRPGLEISRVR